MAGDNTRAATGGSHLISEARDAPMANIEDTSHQCQVFSAEFCATVASGTSQSDPGSVRCRSIKPLQDTSWRRRKHKTSSY